MGWTSSVTATQARNDFSAYVQALLLPSVNEIS